MSFTRVNGGGWALHAQLTSAQINQLDVDHVMSADKSVAGDTIQASWTMSGAGSGITISGTSQGIALNSGTALNLAATSSLKTTAAGGIQLGGGIGDWPTFKTLQTRNVWVGADASAGLVSDAQYVSGVLPVKFVYAGTNGPQLGSATSVGTAAMVTTASGASGNSWVYCWPIRPLHNGATLSSVTVSLQPANHANLPNTMPAIGVFRTAFGASGSLLSLSGGVSVDASTTTTAYNALHTIAYTSNQNNVVDTTQFAYYLAIWDEAGTNAVAANRYFGMSLSYLVANMQFP